MAVSLENKLVVAISSRALFDFEEENRVFEEKDDRAYMKLQLARLDEPAKPGVAFSLVKKLLAFRRGGEPAVEVVILSRNDPVSGMRVFRSARHFGLPIERGVFTRGEPPWRYLASLSANLFLSAEEADVRHALEAGVPAARVLPHSAQASDAHPHEVRIAFDGDAVLFSDEAEQVFQRDGLDAFQRHEAHHVDTPLPPGPFKPLLEALHRLQQSGSANMRLRTALVTARSAPAHERAIRTLMDWHIEVDEAFFLGGLDKGPFLRDFEPDFFFDDQTRHCESASAVAPAGHVAHGVTNTPRRG
jgi:5'-nucleotidase